MNRNTLNPIRKKDISIRVQEKPFKPQEKEQVLFFYHYRAPECPVLLNSLQTIRDT